MPSQLQPPPLNTPGTAAYSADIKDGGPGTITPTRKDLHHRPTNSNSSVVDSKRRQTLLTLLDALTELQRGDDGFTPGSFSQSKIEKEVEEPTEAADEQLQKAGAETFNRFQKRINNLDRELRNFANASRQLGSSVGILSSAFHLRERLAQVLFLFRENAADLFPRKVSRQKIEQPPPPPSSTSTDGFRKKRANRPATAKAKKHHRAPHVARPIILQELDAEEFPDQLEMLGKDIQAFLKSLNEFPEFTDEVVNNSINSFEADLSYWASCLRTYIGQFKYPAVQRYLHDLSSEMEEHLDSITSSLTMFLEIGIPTIRFAQKHAASNLLNLTTVSTFFSAVTATTLQFSFDQTQTPLSNAVNSFWFCSLVFSIASAVNSLLGLTWKQAMYRSPSNRVPWWVLIWIKRSPLIFLVVSVAAFSVGLCVFAYSSGQHPVTSALTTVFTAFSSFGLVAVSAWFVFERWTFNRHSGKKWLMDVLAEIHSRTRRSPPVDWVARVPPQHLKRAATWSEENWRRAGVRLGRVSTFVGDAIVTRARTSYSRSSSSLAAVGNGLLGNGNGRTVQDLEEGQAATAASTSTSPLPQSPRSPLSSVPTLPQLVEVPENASMSRTSNDIPPSTSTVSISTSASDGAAATATTSTLSADAQPTPGKRRFKDIVRNVMLVRQSAAGIGGSMLPNRKRTASSTVSTDGGGGTGGGRSMSESTLTNIRVSRVASLIPALRSLQPVHYIQPHTALVRHLQFSPDGELLATCSWDRTCAIFRVKDFSLTPRVLAHPQGFVGQVAWSPRGNLILTKMVRGMKLWEPESGVLKKNIDRKCAVQSVAWFPQGEAFLSVEGGEVVKLDLTGKVIDTYHFDKMIIHDVAVTNDQERMLCVATLTASPTGLKPSMSREEKQIIVYNLNDKEIENRVPVLHEVRDITLAKDGNFALVSYEYKAPPQLWKLDLLKDRNEEGTMTSRLSLVHTYMPKGQVDFAGSSYFGGKDDQLVLCSGKAGDVHIWDRKSALELHQFKTQDRQEADSDSDLTCIAWNPAVMPFMFAAGSHDGTVTIWTGAPPPPTLTSSAYVDLRHSGTSTPARTITPPPPAQTLAPDAPRCESPMHQLEERRLDDALSRFHLTLPPRERSEERRSSVTFQPMRT